jgi:hypothetical protein
MIIFNDISQITQFYQIEIRQHILESIAKFTNGATYDPSIYGKFALVEPGDATAEIEAATACQILHDRFKNSRYGDLALRRLTATPIRPKPANSMA